MENVNRDKYYISPFSADLRMGQVNFYPSGSVMAGLWKFPWVRQNFFVSVPGMYIICIRKFSTSTFRFSGSMA